ncbi:MAG TPA: tyrosine-type recombinase/integrase [Bacteroidales bacterium]|nr:tyrosine-type recombinase/integrase [Bacteroidales bacterium]
MATFHIVLDKRSKLKDGKYNLAVRIVNGNDVMYVNIQKMTETNYNRLFNGRAKDKEDQQFLDTCNGYITKCNKIFSELKPFNKETFRKRFWETEKDKPKSLLLTELFDYYIQNKENIKPTTADSLRYSRNRFENFKPGVSVGDVSVSFLRRFERNEIDKDNSRATIDHHMRNLRSILNYFIHYVKVIPKEYEYPFGPGGFTVSGYFPSTQVLSESEIQSVINLNEFESHEHKFARDIWVMLYRFNGANFADLLRMKWSQINGDFIFFTRKKTEDTRKNNRKPIIVPLTDKLKDSITRVGDKNGPFLLGLLKEGYDEVSFKNRNHKIRQKINQKLRDIGKKLELSQALNLGSARDCYSNTLYRNNTDMKKISQMLGHSNVVITEHYLAGLNPNVTFGINTPIL